jgi:hypothetical protein
MKKKVHIEGRGQSHGVAANIDREGGKASSSLLEQRVAGLVGALVRGAGFCGLQDYYIPGSRRHT